MQESAARGLRQYIELVAAATGVGDTFIDTDVTPASAYLPLPVRQPSFPGVDLALTWNEVHGWAVALEAVTGDLIVLSYLGYDVLPAPAAVTRFLDQVLTSTYPGRREPPLLRIAGIGDELEQKLAEYQRYQE
jgi:hypothetical protein